MSNRHPPHRAKTNLAINQWKTCDAPGCALPRTGFNNHCNTHKKRARLYGHAAAQPIPEKEYRSEVEAVQALFTEQSDHPGLVASLKALEDWLQQARRGEGLSVKAQPFPSAPEVARLARYGAPAVDLLATLFGFLYWSDHHRTSRLPSDQARDFALSHALMKLAPRPVRSSFKGKGTRILPKFAPLLHMGSHLRQWLAPLYPVVAQALDNRDQQREEVLASFRQPFKAPAVSILQGIKPT